MTTDIRPADPLDLDRVTALLAAAGGSPTPLVEAIAEGRVLLAAGGAGAGEDGVGDGVAGVAIVALRAAPAGAAGAEAGSAAWIWVAPGEGRAEVASALAAAACAPAGGGDGATAAAAPSVASIHVQTDDTGYIERTVRQIVPRLGRSAGTAYLPARDGWVGVYDDLCDHDRRAQRRLAEELSVRLGLVVVALAVEEGDVVRMLLYERGRMVDEYLSVPLRDGPLPPGETLALAVNPTLVARLTGADAGAVRAVARTAASSDRLPPAPELAADISAMLGLHGGAAGFAWAVAVPGATLVEHG